MSTPRSRRLVLALLASACVAPLGCSSEPGAATVDKPAATDSDTAPRASAAADDDPDQPFVLGSGLEPFEPPPLEELDKLAWREGRVLDSMEALRAEQQSQGPPELTAEQALALKNDSPENNEKILAALGRVAPADGAGVDYNARIVRHVGGDLNSTNPLFVSSVTDSEFADLTSIALLGFDRDLTYFAPKEIVKSWQTTDDAMIDRFVLRDDLTWSDGKPVTAHDVEFSFRLIMSDHPKLIIPSVRTGVDQLRWIKAYDDHTLAIFHKAPLATNQPNMIFPILPKHIYEKSVYEDPSLRASDYHTRQEAKPVVAGAFEFASRKRNEEFVVRRRESYFKHNGAEVRPRPYFSEVRVKVIEDVNTALLALKAGDIDQMELRPEHWESQTTGDDFYRRNTKVTQSEWTEFHVEW
ncbi:MAG TPA: ABC transporter substrate-binding protein, partial [Lacipirellulaceae bacterium]|nr:ABC transporter substrate-binding protein [Lacipirellulaceae bacterium]